MDIEKYLILPRRMYDDIKRAGMDIRCLPQQRLTEETFSEYVKRVPRAPK